MALEITEKTIVEKWAPPVVVERKGPSYRQKAATYEAVYDRMIEIGQTYGVSFHVWLDPDIGDNITKLRVFHDFHKVIVYTEKNEYLIEYNGGWIPGTASFVADFCANYLTKDE